MFPDLSYPTRGQVLVETNLIGFVCDQGPCHLVRLWNRSKLHSICRLGNKVSPVMIPRRKQWIIFTRRLRPHEDNCLPSGVGGSNKNKSLIFTSFSAWSLRGCRASLVWFMKGHNHVTQQGRAWVIWKVSALGVELFVVASYSTLALK